MNNKFLRHKTAFGKELCKLRVDAEHYMPDQAKLLGLTPTELSRIEHGEMAVSLRVFNQVVSKYNVRGYDQIRLRKAYEASKATKMVVDLRKMNNKQRAEAFRFYKRVGGSSSSVATVI